MSSPSAQSIRDTLYSRVGGEAGVSKLVDWFYERVLKDPELEPYFRTVPMEKLGEMQRQFFAAALDGPVSYSGRPIYHVHKGRGITSRQLSRFTEHLLATIEGIHPNEKEVREIYSRIALYGDQVLDGPSGGTE